MTFLALIQRPAETENVRVCTKYDCNTSNFEKKKFHCSGICLDHVGRKTSIYKILGIF